MDFIGEGSDGQVYGTSDNCVVKIFHNPEKYSMEKIFLNTHNTAIRDICVVPTDTYKINGLIYPRARGQLMYYVHEFTMEELDELIADFKKRFFALVESGYIYVDFKPANIVLMDTNKIMLVDLCGLVSVSEYPSKYNNYINNYVSPYEVMSLTRIPQYYFKERDNPVMSHFFFYLSEYGFLYDFKPVNIHNYNLALSKYPDVVKYLSTLRIINDVVYVFEDIELKDSQKFKIKLFEDMLYFLWRVVHKTK